MKPKGSQSPEEQAAANLYAAMSRIGKKPHSVRAPLAARPARRCPPTLKLTPDAARARFLQREEVVLQRPIWLPSQSRLIVPPTRLRTDGLAADWLVSYKHAIRATGRDTRALDVTSDTEICVDNRVPGEWFWLARAVMRPGAANAELELLLLRTPEDDDHSLAWAQFVDLSEKQRKEDAEIGKHRRVVALTNDPSVEYDPEAMQAWREDMRPSTTIGKIEQARALTPHFAGSPEAAPAAETLAKLEEIALRMGPRGQISTSDALLAAGFLERFASLTRDLLDRRQIRRRGVVKAEAGRQGGLAKAAADHGQTQSSRIRDLLSSPEFVEMARADPRRVASLVAERLGVTEKHVREVRRKANL